MSAPEKVPCPYCGEEMECEYQVTLPVAAAMFFCTKCGSCSPLLGGVTLDQAKERARAAALRRYTLPQKPLTVDVLRRIPLYAWVWIEILDPDAFRLWGKMAKSAYYGKLRDDPNKHEFWCGFPAFACAFDYSRYGKSWIAFQHEPTEAEKEAAKQEESC